MTAPQSASATVERVVAGASGWVALGDFVDDWRRADRAGRVAMVDVEPAWPESVDSRRWAALVAATVDWLSRSSTPPLAAPPWARSRRYVLPEPWFLLPGTSLRMHQLVDTPAAFSVRNIFGGDRIVSRV